MNPVHFNPSAAVAQSEAGKAARLTLFVATLLLFLASPARLYAQTDISAENSSENVTKAEQTANDEGEPPCEMDSDAEPEDESATQRDSRGCTSGDSLSNYSATIAADVNNSKTVESDLISSDTIKPAIFPIDVVHSRFAGIYRLKERIHDTFGLAFSVDYSLLAQRASHTEGEANSGSSSVFRILGTWLRMGDRDGTNGVLVWKTETRNPIWGNPTPRDLGFTTGSALSTANFKSLEWGITDLYWRQRFNGRRHALLVGHMDPGDWADQYPLLNAWTSFLSDAFYNNPTEAIPKRGFGIVGQSFFDETLYFGGGVHDANGGDGDLDFDSFWDTREWFSWAELGYRSNPTASARNNAHIHYWHQDAREEAGTQESRGMAFTYSRVNDRDGVSFIRAGFSRGGAAQMRRFIGVGMSYKPKGRDTLGIATSWGSPPDKSLRDQITSEIFYRVQVTQNLTFTPSLQVTFKPSFTLETKWLYVPGLRMRFVF
jgi:porin